MVLPEGGAATRVPPGTLLRAVADTVGGVPAVHVLHQRLLIGELHIVSNSCDSSSPASYTSLHARGSFQPISDLGVIPLTVSQHKLVDINASENHFEVPAIWRVCLQ